MTVQEYRNYIAAGNPVGNGSEAHLFMHQMAQEAIRITMEINNKYHTPEELRELFSELWDIDVPETFGMFPPFNTDCGKIPISASEYSSIAVVSSRIKEASSLAMIAL